MWRLFHFVMILALLVLSLAACAADQAATPTLTPTLDMAAFYEPSPVPAEETPTPEPNATITASDAQMELDLGIATPARRSSGRNTINFTATQRVHLPILVYHHIQVVPANASAVLRGLSVAPAEFDKQMAYLAAHNYHTIYFSDLVAYFRDGRPLPENPIILTFDDGWVAQYTVAYPILIKYGLVGTFFPPTNWVDRTTGSVLNWNQIVEMSAGGMEIGSHTVTHYLMAPRTEAQNRYELLTSKRLIEQHTRRPVVALAYPGGSFNANVVKLLPETGYGAAVSMLSGVEQSYGEIYTLRRTPIRYWDTLEMFAQKLR